MKKILKEWYVSAPWGKIALASWGNPEGYPVILVHGRQDSLSTFVPLMELLSDDFNYVALDLPGCGKSDPFPTGVMLLRFHFVPAVDVVLRNLMWREFYYIGHSLGTEIAFFYNAIYPNRIKKLVLLDPIPAIRKIQVKDPPTFMRHFYHNYYEDYRRQNSHDKVYTKAQALDAVAKSRDVSEKEAEVLLSRNLIPVGEDQYKLSWDRRLRLPAILNFEKDVLFHLITVKCPPTLMINGLQSTKYPDGRDETIKLMEDVKDNVKNFTIIDVNGDHDVHFKKPELFANKIDEFLRKDVGECRGKL